MENKLAKISIENQDVIAESEKAVEIITNSIGELKNYVVENHFKSRQEEIIFFKELKPQIFSRYIYYSTIYNIEILKPQGHNSILRGYFIKEFKQIKKHFNSNIDFYKYYRSGSSQFDELYFTRKKFDFKLNSCKHYLDTDLRFSTSHDTKVAQIMANNLLENYLKEQIADIGRQENNQITSKNTNNKSILQWTGTKTDAVEFIYGLIECGAINHGFVNIKDAVHHFGIFLNIEINDYSGLFSDIKSRKSNQTSFSDKMKNSLINRIDSDNQKRFRK